MLVPVCDAEGRGDAFFANGTEPWLRLAPAVSAGLAGSMVEIAYRASLWDEPARPVFRFFRDDDVVGEAVGPAPLEAAAIWQGRIPSRTTCIHVSPTNKPGPFGFRIESIRWRGWLGLYAEGRRRAPGPAKSAMLTRLIGWAPESDNNLAWAIGAHSFETYGSWAARRRRAVEPEGIDAPRRAADAAMAFLVIVRADDATDPTAIERTVASLQAQTFPRWQVLVSPSEADVVDARSGGAWIAVLPAGVVLRPQSLAIVAERRARDPDASLFYGDELVGGRPLLKPGWSPRLAAALPYLGNAVFASPAAVSDEQLEALLRGAPWTVPPGVVPKPLRRIVAEVAGPTVELAAYLVGQLPAAETRAAIIILTRDQPALLARLVASIRARTTSGSYRLVVVDNGEQGGPASEVLTELASAADSIVLHRPGPFNFSGLCNEAVAATNEPMLVFLNDDMEVRSERWLDRLVALAGEPDVGAVGAKLTYPDGRLQHVGVLLGMGGSAGHFGAPAPGDDPGWSGRNQAIHEVSAVTGACLAVARAKFEAVGGFDAEHLPVELSDIDLCLKLKACGWQTLVDPSVHLLHEESFSRGGATFRRLSKYGDQRAIFLDRWRRVVRDDPVFHPALSLYSWRAALG